MFSFFSPQEIHFGRGQSLKTAARAKAFGQTILIAHGATPARAEWLVASCKDSGLTVQTIGCKGEPSLPQIEDALETLKGLRPDVVIAVGGGSVLDFGKALSALLPCAGPPLDYLEGVGAGRELERPPLPMIALPTTAGTGAEVTKNAVISVPQHGVKVSLRDPRMVPDVAVVDASLMQGAPSHVALAAGLDAITQVIEPYLSIKANPMTDALCHAAIPLGLGVVRDLVENDSPDAWDKMAWVSTCGGLALANAGLGAVHGFAGVIGGKTHAPHGEICGTLLPAVLQAHQRQAIENTDIHERLFWVLDQIDRQFAPENKGAGIEALRDWSRDRGIRGLRDLGVAPCDHNDIAAAATKASSMKGNPFVLSQQELVEILCAADEG